MLTISMFTPGGPRASPCVTARARPAGPHADPRPDRSRQSASTPNPCRVTCAYTQAGRQHTVLAPPGPPPHRMHTFLNRAQRACGTFSTAASVSALAVALLATLQLFLSGAWSLGYDVGSVEPRMRLHNTRRFGAVDGHQKENARFNFDLDADLTPLFNWNTKQVFAYVTADYTTVSAKSGAQSANSVVVWDKIITAPERANLALRNEHGKYSVYDIQSAFGGPDRAVNLTLRWNVQPKVGFLLRGQAAVAGSAKVQLPPLKRAKKEEA